MTMRIVLVRHGKPSGVSTAAMSGQAVGQWVRLYEEAGIARDVAPPAALSALASASRCVLVSDVRRARESAAWLAPSARIRIDPELREAPLPENLKISIRLPSVVWVVLARVGWLLNFCDVDETLAMTRQRAERVACRLAVLAEEQGTVMAVGHGMFNRFLASALRRRGWRGPRFLRNGYWATATFDRFLGAPTQNMSGPALDGSSHVNGSAAPGR